MRPFIRFEHGFAAAAAICLSYFFILMSIIAFEANQRSAIQNDIAARSDSPMTLVFQFDREYLRLRNAIQVAIVSAEPLNREDLNLRLDILHSRLDLLRRSPAAAEIVAEKNVDTLLNQVAAIHDFTEQVLATPTITREGLATALLRLDGLQQQVQALSFETNTRIFISIERQLQAELQQVNLVIVFSLLQVIVLVVGIGIFRKRQGQLQALNASLKMRVDERTVAKVEAEAANHSKSRFLAAASHDLRQPMSALALYASVLPQAVTAGNETLASNIQHCVASLSNLLNDLFELSRLESGAVAVTPAEFSIDGLFDSMLANYGASAEKKGLSLCFRHGTHIILRTDQQLFHRLLGNLIDNALKFTLVGGVLVASRRRKGRLWIEVWDTGLGIPQQDIAPIFEEFRQLGDASRNRGSGLGLSIVARIAALLGLELQVRSHPGRGSVFAIELPTGGAALPIALPMPVGTAVFTIGIIEDNRQVLAALQVTLKSLGHTVFGGSTPTELLTQLGRQVPDIVISDYRLESAFTGLDAIASLRACFGRDMAAIILTGDTDPDLSGKLAAHGIAVYKKPMPLHALQRTIEQAVNGQARPAPGVLVHAH